MGPLTVSFVNGNPAEPPRVAYAIGRKVGNAVQRNRIRRQLRAIVRQLTPQLRAGKYLIGVAPQPTPLRYGELQRTVMRALEAIAEQEKRRPARQPLSVETAAARS